MNNDPYCAVCSKRIHTNSPYENYIFRLSPPQTKAFGKNRLTLPLHNSCFNQICLPEELDVLLNEAIDKAIRQ